MILILSNNPLSYSDSNGRTIANMFLSYKKEELLNVFISGTPEIKLANYIQITDKDALLGTLKEHVFENINNIGQQSHKSAFKVSVREFIWKHSKVKNKLIKKLSDYEITDIFVQLGDYSFVLDLGIFIAKELNLRLITFNTEDYYFKTWNYYERKKEGLIFRRHQNKLKDSYKKIYAVSEKNIFLTKDLEEIHKKEFEFLSSIVIYTSSNIEPSEPIKNNKIISYCGNLNNGRDEVLVKLIDCVNNIDGGFEIDIYSPYLPEMVRKKITKTNNVFYKGFIKYENTINVISESFLNVSIDGFDNYSRKDTIHGFSTKLADLISSGNRVLLISPKESTSFRYLSENSAAYLCSDLDKLNNVVSKIVSDSDEDYIYKENALLLAKANHDAVTNSFKFKSYLDDKENINFDILVTTINKNPKELIELANEMNIKTSCYIRTQNQECDAFNSIKDKNLNLMCGTDKGTSVNRNKLFNCSNSDYILFADDDIIFDDDYQNQLSNVIRNNSFPDAIEFSFYSEDKKLVKRQNKKSNYYVNSRYGVWFMLLSRRAILNVFGDKPFNEKFGPGAKYRCGEDSIFRFKAYKSFKNIVDSRYVLGCIGDKPSTWFTGKNVKYFEDRSVFYGFIYPLIYPLFLFRLKFQNLFNKNCSLLRCIKKAREGKRLFNEEKELENAEKNQRHS